VEHNGTEGAREGRLMVPVRKCSDTTGNWPPVCMECNHACVSQCTRVVAAGVVAR